MYVTIKRQYMTTYCYVKKNIYNPSDCYSNYPIMHHWYFFGAPSTSNVSFTTESSCKHIFNSLKKSY